MHLPVSQNIRGAEHRKRRKVLNLTQPSASQGPSRHFPLWSEDNTSPAYLEGWFGAGRCMWKIRVDVPDVSCGGSFLAVRAAPPPTA